MVSCISRLKDHYSILCFQQFIHRVQSFFCYSFFLADSCHNTESLWFNKNLSFFAFFWTNLFRLCIIGTQEPFSVPSIIQHCLIHLIHCFPCFFCKFCVPGPLTELLKFFSIFHKHTCNKYRFCHRAFRRPCCLKGFSRFTGKTVQIQAVIPVCPSDQRKFVRTKMGYCVIKRFLQMFKKRYLCSLLTIKGYLHIKYPIITSLFDICCYCCDQP